MQSHYIYALLSNNTYHNATYNLPPNWKEFKGSFPILIPSDNFYAFPYVNEVLKKIIIAFRGSDTWKNYAADDIEIFVNLAPSLFLSKAVPYVKAVLDEAIRRYPAFEISFTGHSLGAILAELCAAKYTKQAVTFESPGSYNMIDGLVQKKTITIGRACYNKNYQLSSSNQCHQSNKSIHWNKISAVSRVDVP